MAGERDNDWVYVIDQNTDTLLDMVKFKHMRAAAYRQHFKNADLIFMWKYDADRILSGQLVKVVIP